MSVSLFEMLKNLSYDARLGDEADHLELATAAFTKERVDFVHPTDKIRPPTSKRGSAGVELWASTTRRPSPSR